MPIDSIFAEIQHRIRSAVEDRGLSAEQVMEEIHEQAQEQMIREQEGSSGLLKDNDEEIEKFPGEIRLIAQALAYRTPETWDLPYIHQLLNHAYKPEIKSSSLNASNNEAFRSDEVAVTEESVRFYLESSEYAWLLVEAPNGHGIEEDGAILGVCCYSTSGISRRNGQVEGNVGSIRYFAVLPRYHGLCIGQRLLNKVEDRMQLSGCCRSLACVPSTRKSICSWLERRGYRNVQRMPYPFDGLGQVKLSDAEEIHLFQFTKSFVAATAPVSAYKTENIDPESNASDEEEILGVD